MAPVVLLTTARLRNGLLDLLTDPCAALHAALLSVVSADLDVSAARGVSAARRHYAKLRAAGDLLDAIGWTPGEVAAPFRLDVAVHGWAATTALQRVIARERFASWEHAEAEELEESGRAGGLRHDAERELALIEDACEQAGFTITPPTP